MQVTRYLQLIPCKSIQDTEHYAIFLLVNIYEFVTGFVQILAQNNQFKPYKAKCK